MGALFRLVELTSGSISIDGIDISTLGLHELREQIAIIPQEPLLFSVRQARYLIHRSGNSPPISLIV